MAMVAIPDFTSIMAIKISILKMLTSDYILLLFSRLDRIKLSYIIFAFSVCMFFSLSAISPSMIFRPSVCCLSVTKTSVSLCQIYL